jgi:hypothetical protein
MTISAVTITRYNGRVPVPARSVTTRLSDKFTLGGTGCWQWKAAFNTYGYGVMWVDAKRRARQAHIILWEMFNGPVPPGLNLDHLCRNKGCVRPSHLEAVTSGENTLRGHSPSAYNAVKTHCIHGHEFTETNTYRFNGTHRGCRECRKAATNRHNKTRRA